MYYWLIQIWCEDCGFEVWVNGEWCYFDIWWIGFWMCLFESICEECQIFDGVCIFGDDFVLENIIEWENGVFVLLWIEFEMCEEVFLCLNVCMGCDCEVMMLVNVIDGSLLDSVSVDVDNVFSFNFCLCWNCQDIY